MRRRHNVFASGGTAVAISVALLAGACADPASMPTAPTTTARPPAADVPRRFPAISRPGRIYVGVDSPSYPHQGSPLESRYVLYDDGTFALQYSSANFPFVELRGTYQEADALITFEWESSNIAGPWGATGTLDGDSLSVRYNLVMQWTDFEDGVYIRER